MLSTASETMVECLRLLRNHDLDCLINFLPESVVVYTAVAKGAILSEAPLAFTDVAEAMQQKDPSQHFLDSYALRNVVLSSIQLIEPLSSVSISSERFLQRCLVTCDSGEECILTFTLSQRDPTDMSTPYPRMVKTPWVLTGVKGEPAASELPTAPSPAWPPELVVEASLQALKEGNFHALYAFSSPCNKALTGPLDRFISVLTRDSRYAPLVNHSAVRSLRRFQFQHNTFLEVVHVTHPSGRSAGVYSWIVRLQREEGALRGCWMTDYVQVIDDQRLLRVLGNTQ